MKPCLVGEGRLADIGLLVRRRHVDDFSNVMAHGGQAVEPIGGDGADVQLQTEVWDRRGQVGVTRALAVAVDAALHLRDTCRNGGE